MKISVILANPGPGSFNHSIAAAAVDTLRQNGHSVCFHDLYGEGFDPVLSAAEVAADAALSPALAAHCQEAAEAQGFVIVHPNWWGQPPAILKGWVDRVFRPGVAYNFLDGDSGGGVPVGLLKANKAIVFNTSNTPAKREQPDFGDPLELIWKKCIFGLCGVKDVRRETFSVVITSSQEQRESWLASVKEIVAECFPV